MDRPTRSLRINTENQQYLSKYLPLAAYYRRKHSWHQLDGQIIIKEHRGGFFPLYFSHEQCQTPKLLFFIKDSKSSYHNLKYYFSLLQ